LGDLQVEADWIFHGLRKQKSTSDLRTGQGPWINSGLLEKAAWEITFNVTPDNENEINKVKKHDRLKPIPFSIDGRQQDTCYLNSSKPAGDQITFFVSNEF
jgi:hypothetical protein